MQRALVEASAQYSLCMKMQAWCRTSNDDGHVNDGDASKRAGGWRPDDAPYICTAKSGHARARHTHTHTYAVSVRSPCVRITLCGVGIFWEKQKPRNKANNGAPYARSATKAIFKKKKHTHNTPVSRASMRSKNQPTTKTLNGKETAKKQQRNSKETAKKQHLL